jgi:fucose permease
MWSIVPLGLAVVATCLMVEPEAATEKESSESKDAKASDWRAMVRLTGRAVGSLRRDRVLTLLVLFGVGVQAFQESAHQFKGVLLTERGMAAPSLGTWGAFAFVLSSAGSFLSTSASSRLGDTRALLACVVLTSATLLLASAALSSEQLQPRLLLPSLTQSAAPTEGIGASTPWLTSFAAFLLSLGSISWGVQWPIVSNLTNDRVPVDSRATVISLVALCKRLGLACLVPVVAYVADSRSVPSAYVV